MDALQESWGAKRAAERKVYNTLRPSKREEDLRRQGGGRDYIRALPGDGLMSRRTGPAARLLRMRKDEAAIVLACAPNPVERDSNGGLGIRQAP